MSNLLSILQPSDSYLVPNDPDGGALVINGDGYILKVQKPETVIIPRLEMSFPVGTSENARGEVINNHITEMLWAVVNIQGGQRAEGTGCMPRVPEHLVLEELQAQINPPDQITWLLAYPQATFDVAARIAAVHRASNGPMEAMRTSQPPSWIHDSSNPSNIIIGAVNPSGFYLNHESCVLKGEGEGEGVEVFYGDGWLIYPNKIAAVELIPAAD